MRVRAVLAGAAIVLTSGINAADVAAKSPSIPTPTASPWSGPYVGGLLGVSQGTADWDRPTGFGINAALPRLPATGRSNGILAGATAGFNLQSGAWVAGVEADIAGTTSFSAAVCGGVYDYNGSFVASYDLKSTGSWTCKSQTRMLVTLGPRIGYAAGRALIYGKAGLAIDRSSYALDGLAASLLRPARVTRAASEETSLGMMVGLGLEYALNDRWSAKIEYNHIRLVARQWQGFDPDWGEYQGARTRQSHDIVKFGLNYRWGNPGAAAYLAVSASTGFSGEFGARIGRTFGDYRLDLGDNWVPGQMNSRLSWTGQQALATEAFGRVDHDSGLFTKGMIGGLGLFSGKMFDEDYPPVAVPYSNTKSRLRSSNGLYATADVGWAYRGPGWRLGVFGGFSHNQQRMQAYGCDQLDAGDFCAGDAVLPGNFLVMSRDENWNGVRFGLAGDIDVTDRLRLSVDAAYLPRLSYRGRDNHWARPDINPMVDTGYGHGYQIEAIASYRVSDRVSLGVGARRWASKSKGSVSFPGSSPAPVTTRSERTTVFFQASYAFGAMP